MSDPVSRTYCSVNKNAHCGDQLIIKTVNTTCQFFDTENCTQFAATSVHNFDLVFRFRLLVFETAMCKTIFKKTNMSSCFQSVWYVDAEASSDIKNQPKETPKKRTMVWKTGI